MKQQIALFIMASIFIFSRIDSMDKIGESTQSHQNTYLDHQLRREVEDLVNNNELNFHQKKRACSELLFKIIDRGPQPDSTDLLESLLMNGADPDIKHGETALYLATTKNDIQAVRLLLKYQADANVQNFFSQQTPLMQALNKGASPKLIKLLLKHGADPNIGDTHRKTALMKAFQFPGSVQLTKFRKQIVYMLLFHGADVTSTDTNFKSAIDIAQSHGFTDFVEIMKMYPNTHSLKDICNNYIRKNQKQFDSQLHTLPQELREHFQKNEKEE